MNKKEVMKFMEDSYDHYVEIYGEAQDLDDLRKFTIMAYWLLPTQPRDPFGYSLVNEVQKSKGLLKKIVGQ